jgi:hypothetical protein
MQAVHSVYLPFIARGAGGLPDKAATARYVRWNWNEFGNYDTGGEQRFVRLAYWDAILIRDML